MISFEAIRRLFSDVTSKLTSLDNKMVYVNTNKTQDIWDYAVENDLAFVASKVLLVANAASREVVFINPQGSGKTLYVRLLQIWGAADGIVQIHLNPTITTNGTAIPKLNKKAGGTNTSVAILEYDGTYTGYSADYTEALLTGGSKNFAVGGAATVGLAGQILEGSGLYIKITNNSGADANYCVRIEWWEQ